MGRFKNIIVAGDIGTGTTTLAKNLASKLDWGYESIGEFFRSYTKEHDIPLWDKEAIPDEVDEQADADFFEKIKNNSHVVFDSHYASWFARDLEDIHRILLICDPETATDRILEREHGQETTENIDKRRAGIRAKFKKLYSDEDYEDPKLFHLIMDTTHTSIEAVTNQAFKEFTQATGD